MRVIMVNWDSFWQSWDKYLFAVSLPSAPEKTCLDGKIHRRSPECLSCADTTSIPGSVSQHALVFESTWSLKARCQETSHSNPPQRIRNTMSLAAAQKCLHPALKAFWAQSSGQPICFSEQTVVKLQSPHCGIIILKNTSNSLARPWSGGALKWRKVADPSERVTGRMWGRGCSTWPWKRRHRDSARPFWSQDDSLADGHHLSGLCVYLES